MSLRQRAKAMTDAERSDRAAVRTLALSWLSRRDFAPQELRERLCARGYAAEAAQEVLAELTACGVLNEARYAENYVAWHAARGRGPLRVGADLRKHGISAELSARVLAEGADWGALARKVCRARFGAAPPGSWRERARQARFLQYRGFSADHIRAATGADPDLDQRT